MNTNAELSSRCFKNADSATFRSTVARVSVVAFNPATSESRKAVIAGKLPRISPPPNCVVWKLMYARPSLRFANCAANVVPLPSGGSHLPLIVPPTPEANGVFTTSLGLLSLSGAPKKPQTTGPLTPGATDGPACMWAATKLSFVSAVCEPVKSRLLIVAVNVICVCAVFMLKVAVPKDAARRAPPVVVGFVGGFSCAFVRFTTKLLGDSPALISRLSTYWSLVRVAGYLLTNSGRLTKSAK